MFATTLTIILFQGFSIASSLLLSRWSSDTEAITSEGTQDTSKRNSYLSIYAALGFGQGIRLNLFPEFQSEI